MSLPRIRIRHSRQIHPLGTPINHRLRCQERHVGARRDGFDDDSCWLTEASVWYCVAIENGDLGQNWVLELTIWGTGKPSRAINSAACEPSTGCWRRGRNILRPTPRCVCGGVSSCQRPTQVVCEPVKSPVAGTSRRASSHILLRHRSQPFLGVQPDASEGRSSGGFRLSRQCQTVLTRTLAHLGLSMLERGLGCQELRSFGRYGSAVDRSD
jgi:hypothetical protein